MLIVVANYLPNAVRGRMKLWFLEPKPNVFVSGIKYSVANTVIDYLVEHCPLESGIVIFQSIKKPPGYVIRSIGMPLKSVTEINGLQLIIEKKHNSHI